MSDEMREKVATVVTQNVYSGDFDRLTDAILALFASELERVERDFDDRVDALHEANEREFKRAQAAEALEATDHE